MQAGLLCACLRRKSFLTALRVLGDFEADNGCQWRIPASKTIVRSVDVCKTDGKMDLNNEGELMCAPVY
jgi:hypothetical protein